MALLLMPRANAGRPGCTIICWHAPNFLVLEYKRKRILAILFLGNLAPSSVYLGGPDGVRIPSSEFFEPFPPDLKFGYRRDTHRVPEHFIRAYRLRDPKSAKDGPWLAGLTLEPSVVYEAWCSQRPGNIIVMIQEIHGKPTKAGDSFSAAHIVGFFDSIEEMHQVYARYKGHTALSASPAGWRLEK